MSQILAFQAAGLDTVRFVGYQLKGSAVSWETSVAGALEGGFQWIAEVAVEVTPKSCPQVRIE